MPPSRARGPASTFPSGPPTTTRTLKPTTAWRWRIDDTFDFDNPVTDYDRLCRRHLEEKAPVLINELREHAFASISDGSDIFCWWPELGVISANAASEPTADAVERAAFVRVGVIDVPSGLLWLMNPCSHGAAVRRATTGGSSK